MRHLLGFAGAAFFILYFYGLYGLLENKGSKNYFIILMAVINLLMFYITAKLITKI